MEKETTATAAPMTQAYDFANLAERGKKVGLNGTEDTVKAFVGEVCEWLQESARLSPTKLDDVAVGAFLATAKEAVLGLADKIDGEVG